MVMESKDDDGCREKRKWCREKKKRKKKGRRKKREEGGGEDEEVVPHPSIQALSDVVHRRGCPLHLSPKPAPPLLLWAPIDFAAPSQALSPSGVKEMKEEELKRMEEKKNQKHGKEERKEKEKYD